jgi:EAL and modified HD-GYP domain-containing signal transduction protein
MTARVLAESIGSIGLAAIAGSATLFVNFGQDLLQDMMIVDLLPADSIVIEVLESVEPSRQLCDSLAALGARGFQIALDDFVYHASLEPLLNLADYVKVDVLAMRDSLKEQVGRLKPYDVRLLAEKVESRAEFDECVRLGFDLFQGYYFCRPETLDMRPLAANQLVVLELVAALQDPSNDMKALAQIISRDVAVSYQLLKLANSPLIRQRRRIATVQDAMVILGRDSVKKWTTLLMLSRLAAGKPVELLRTALVRAYMCSFLAASGVGADEDACFTSGLLSVLDALLDRPMEQVLADLALVPEVTRALLGDGRVPVGRVLRQVQAYEMGDWSQAMTSVDGVTLRSAYLEAVASADRVLAEVIPVGRRGG